MLDGAPCLKNGICEAKYPKKYQRHTTYEKNFMPCYRRLAPEWGGHTAQVYCRRLGREVTLGNSHVVPFNRFLLMKYKVRMLRVRKKQGHANFFHGKGCIQTGQEKWVKQVGEFSDILLFSYFVEKSANFIKHINRKITTYKTGEMKKWQRYHGSWENSSYIKRLNGFLDRTGFGQGGIKQITGWAGAGQKSLFVWLNGLAQAGV